VRSALNTKRYEPEMEQLQDILSRVRLLIHSVVSHNLSNPDQSISSSRYIDNYLDFIGGYLSIFNAKDVIHRSCRFLSVFTQTSCHVDSLRKMAKALLRDLNEIESKVPIVISDLLSCYKMTLVNIAYGIDQNAIKQWYDELFCHKDEMSYQFVNELSNLYVTHLLRNQNSRWYLSTIRLSKSLQELIAETEEEFRSELRQFRGTVIGEKGRISKVLDTFLEKEMTFEISFTRQLSQCRLIDALDKRSRLSDEQFNTLSLILSRRKEKVKYLCETIIVPTLKMFKSTCIDIVKNVDVMTNEQLRDEVRKLHEEVDEWSATRVGNNKMFDPLEFYTI